MLPICARAGGASEIVEAAMRAAKPVRAMVRNISRGFNGRIGKRILYRQSAARRASRLTRRIRRGKKGLPAAAAPSAAPPQTKKNAPKPTPTPAATAEKQSKPKNKRKGRVYQPEAVQSED